MRADTALWVRVGAATFGVAAMALAIHELRQPAAPPRPAALAPAAEPDPLTAEFTRCRSLPPEAVDAGCREAWAAHRRRFFAREARP